MKPAPSALPGVIDLPQPYLLFLGDVSVGLPNLTPIEAKRAGARSMLIGIANPGGIVPESWMPCLAEALEAGLDLIAGMHAKLNDMPELASHARTLGRKLIDVRTP